MAIMKSDIRQSMSLLSRIHSQASDFLTTKLAEKGLPNFASSHGFILFQLSLQNAITMKELATRINRDKSTTTVLVRKLEKTGFIQIIPSPDDARSKLVSLTKKGKKYNKMTAALSENLLKIFYKGFTKVEQKEMSTYLARILNNFDSSTCATALI